MAKINHNRPMLLLLDNYRRELKIQSATAGNVFPDATQKSGKNPMPPVSEVAGGLVLSIFDATNLYFDKFSAWLETISPGSKKSTKRKSPMLKEQLEEAEERLVDAFTALVIEAMKEESRKNKGVVAWIDWLQKEAQLTNSSGLYDILEIGMKPACERIAAAIETC